MRTKTTGEVRSRQKQFMIIDTHAHYDDAAFDEDREQLIVALKEQNIIAVDAGASYRSSKAAAALSAQYAHIYALVGVHPEELAEMTEEKLADIAALTKQNPGSIPAQCKAAAGMPTKIAAPAETAAVETATGFGAQSKVLGIGEIGLDYHWEEIPREVQQHWFRRQMELACELQLPVCIHSREAAQDTFDILKSFADRWAGGVMHCYSYGPELAREYLRMGMYFGIGGVLTFKNAKKLKEVVAMLPMDRIVLETDCPYLAPTPHRGERNCSLYLPLVAEEIARIKDISPEEVFRVTAENARKLYPRLQAGEHGKH